MLEVGQKLEIDHIGLLIEPDSLNALKIVNAIEDPNGSLNYALNCSLDWTLSDFNPLLIAKGYSFKSTNNQVSPHNSLKQKLDISGEIINLEHNHDVFEARLNEFKKTVGNQQVENQSQMLNLLFGIKSNTMHAVALSTQPIFNVDKKFDNFRLMSSAFLKNISHKSTDNEQKLMAWGFLERQKEDVYSVLHKNDPRLAHSDICGVWTQSTHDLSKVKIIFLLVKFLKHDLNFLNRQVPKSFVLCLIGDESGSKSDFFQISIDDLHPGVFFYCQCPINDLKHNMSIKSLQKINEKQLWLKFGLESLISSKNFHQTNRKSSEHSSESNSAEILRFLQNFSLSIENLNLKIDSLNQNVLKIDERISKIEEQIENNLQIKANDVRTQSDENKENIIDENDDEFRTLMQKIEKFQNPYKSPKLKNFPANSRYQHNDSMIENTNEFCLGSQNLTLNTKKYMEKFNLINNQPCSDFSPNTPLQKNENPLAKSTGIQEFKRPFKKLNLDAPPSSPTQVPRKILDIEKIKQMPKLL